MARRIIDISVPLQSDIASDPPGQRAEDHLHRPQAERAGRSAPSSRASRPTELPDGEGWAVERIDISTHNGTHLDAPWHFASTMDGGKRAHHHRRGAAGVVLPAGREARFPPLSRTAMSCTRRRRRGGADAHRPHARSRSTSSSSTPSAGTRYGEPDYVPTGCGMGREATLYLTSRGVQHHRHGRLVVGRAVRATRPRSTPRPRTPG